MSDPIPSYEKLGAFFLGREFDPTEGEVQDDILLYDAKDLTTHAVCVGMTGSGKTGLCVGLLEEAAIDGIPALIIDPKGDMGNLMLNFPDLKPADFRPWVDPSAAARKGMTVDQYAKNRADLWRGGLKSWDQGPDRLKRLKEAAEVVIYTPGSDAGLQLTILKSFAAPSSAVLEDSDTFRERVSSSVSGLLSLLRIDADPIRSREHILISNIFDHFWRAGKDLDLVTLIQSIQNPPMERIGVFDTDTFYPSKDRFELAMTMNNLLASPGFSAWSFGEPLEIERLLWSADGRPRLCVLSIAHLSEAERMFFVTTLLNEVVAWVRDQRGTSSLRAILYMDEVFGYLPPVANPPSKAPMLTLLKQARAFGLGVVLATQNPVDLDYKALSNAGTWFLGRLQTERDKLRVIDGLQGAAAAAGSTLNRKRIDELLSGLKSRVFLMNNVHEDEPALFHTRWAMSYLAGPMTRDHIRTLMKDRKATRSRKAENRLEKKSESDSTPKTQERATKVDHLAGAEFAPPVLPDGIAARYLEESTRIPGDLVYRPYLHGTADLHFVDSRKGIDHWTAASYLTPLDDERGSAWDEAEVCDFHTSAFLEEPESRAPHEDLPSAATKVRSYKSWAKQLESHVYKTERLPIWSCKEFKLVGSVGESKASFLGRVSVAQREARDLAVTKIREEYTPKAVKLKAAITSAEDRLEREEGQLKAQKNQSMISIGAGILDAIFGRKRSGMGKATTAARGAARAARERKDVERAEEALQRAREKLENLAMDLESDAARIQEEFSREPEVVALDLKPRKSDIDVPEVLLLWAPFRARRGRSKAGFDLGT